MVLLQRFCDEYNEDKKEMIHSYRDHDSSDNYWYYTYDYTITYAVTTRSYRSFPHYAAMGGSMAT